MKFSNQIVWNPIGACNFVCGKVPSKGVSKNEVTYFYGPTIMIDSGGEIYIVSHFKYVVAQRLLQQQGA
jgi:hypothetical protein